MSSPASASAESDQEGSSVIRCPHWSDDAAILAIVAIATIIVHVLTAYFVVRLLSTDNPRWWIAIGCAIGLGMMAKYTMGFFALGIVGGVLLTDARRYLKSKWLWYGVAASLLIFLPNLVWQAQHHFVSLDFLRHIHERDIRIGRTQGFLPGQLKMTLLAFPLFVAGLYFCLFAQNGRRFRMLGWMYV